MCQGRGHNGQQVRFLVNQCSFGLTEKDENKGRENNYCVVDNTVFVSCLFIVFIGQGISYAVRVSFYAVRVRFYAVRVRFYAVRVRFWVRVRVSLQ